MSSSIDVVCCYQVKASWQQVNSTAYQLVAGEYQLVAGVQQLVLREYQLASGVYQLIPGVYQLVSGECQLVSGFYQLISGKYQLVPGEYQLVSGVYQLIPGVCQLLYLCILVCVRGIISAMKWGFFLLLFGRSSSSVRIVQHCFCLSSWVFPDMAGFKPSQRFSTGTLPHHKKHFA